VEPFFVLSRSRTERALAELLPLLLHLLAESPQPDRTLDNLVRLVSATGGRATFFALLTARPDVLGLLVEVAGWSSYLVESLVDQPGLIDEVMDALNRRPPPAPALFAEARQLVQGLSNPAEPLAFLVAREQCLAAIHDLATSDAEATARRLGTVAEAVLQVLLSRLAGERGRQWGFPLDAGRPVRFAVLALGKLGGDELGYVSDLDVLFVCDPGGACPRSDRDGLAFWTRVAQDLMRTMQEARLQELDARLRPWGEQGELVVDTASFDAYWTSPRELWERLAMVRARPLAGDLRLAQEAVDRLRCHAVAAPLPADAVAQVRAMRLRLEQSVDGQDHPKRGWGGYVDAEFVAQFLCLGRDPGQVLAGSTGTIPTLQRLAAAGLLPAEAAADLAEGVRFLRLVEGRQRLATGTSGSAIPTDPDAREELARRCCLPDRRALDERLHLTRERNRRWFDCLLAEGRPGG
jgi:glutamate-ammonia-ligase adenylyltransferase